MARRLTSLLLAVLLSLSMAAFTAQAEENVTLSVFGIGATIPEDDPIIPELSKRLGVNIIIDNPTADRAAFTARIAGGDIPDVMRVTDLNMITTMYESGVLLNISDYLDRMPNVKAQYEDDYWLPVTFDGSAYAIPARAQVNYMEWYAQYELFESLGLKTPTTFDQLMDVCLAIKNSDLDGNGKNDTYAISGASLTSRNGAFNGFFTAYGVTQPGTIMIRDNKAVYASTTPEFKMAVEEIRRFVDAGVVDPEIVTNNFDTLREKAATGKIAMAYGGWTEFSKAAYQSIMKSVNPNADWRHLETPITTPYGEAGATMTAAGYNKCMCLSADLEFDSEKLDAALRLMDYIIAGEGDILMSYGIEGIHYVMDGDTLVKLDAMSNLTYGAVLQLLGRDDMLYCMTKFPECANEIMYAAEEEKVYKHYGDFVQQPMGINVADIKSYEEEQITQFIFGGRDMAEWDEFINTLENVYNLKGYMVSVNEQLTAQGYLK